MTEDTSGRGNSDYSVSDTLSTFDNASFFRTLVGSTSEGVLAIDKERTIVFANSAIEEIIGYSQDELIGKSELKLIPQQFRRDALELQHYFEPSYLHSRWDDGERFLRHKEGHEVPVDFSVSEFEQDGDSFVAVIIQDITDRKEQERELEQYRALTQAVNDVIVTIDERSTIQSVNPTVADVFGYNQEELVGESLTILMPDEFADYHCEAIERYLETNEKTLEWDYVDLPGQHADGSEIPLAVSFSEVEFEDKRLFTGIIRDISERNRTTRELKDRIRQQEVTNSVGRRALADTDLDQLMHDASKSVADTLGNDYCKVLELLPSGDEGLLRQGVGWRDGLVGNATVPIDMDSQAGYTLLSEDPVVVSDLRTEDRFSGLELLTSHDIVSGISVIIGSFEQPWGILSTHTTERQEYTQHDVNFVQNVANLLAQAIERKQREQELRQETERFQRLVESVEDYAFFMLDPDGHVISWNEGAERIKGYRAEDILGEHFSVFYPDAARKDGLPERALDVAATDGSFEDEGWRVRADGTEFWADVTITPLYNDEGALRGFAKFTQDRTDQHKQAQILQRERDLLETSPVGIVVVNSDGIIERVNAHAGALYDYTPDELRGRAYESVEWNLIDTDGKQVSVDDHPISRVFATGESVSDAVLRIEQSNGRDRWVSVSASPIHDTHDTVERVITAIDDITDRKDREEQLRHQRNTLERVRLVTDTLQSVNRALVQAGTSKEIEQAVCDRLARSESYRFAWIGGSISENHQIEPQTWAGVEDDYLSEIQITADESTSGQGPAGRAIRTQTVQAARNILDDPSFEPWREQALERGYRASAAVPIIYGGTLYGILNLYTSRPFAFDDYEQALLENLGERIGHAMYAIKNRQLVHTDTVIELTFQSTASAGIFIPLSEELDCRLELKKYTPTSDGAYVCYVTVEGVAPERVHDRLMQASAVKHVRVTQATGKKGVIEFTISSASPEVMLANHGATITKAVTEQGKETLVGEVAPDADTRTIIERLQAAFPGTELISKRPIDRPTTPYAEVHGDLLDVLTERQREVLEVAFHAGFFASPRDSTGDELAEVLDISSPTFYQHVRKATQKLLAVTLMDEITS